MAAAVGKFAAQKLLGKQMEQYAQKKVQSGDDPYFAMIEDPKRPGKMKKVKKQIPAYIPEHDALILARAKKTAYRLDMCLFNLFGIRFGWEAVIGLIPFAGDAFGVAMAYLLFQKCCKVDGGLPSSIRTRMMLNILIDFAVGLVPFLGDIADAAFKCNTKNVALLESHLDKKYRPDGSSRRDDDRNFAGVDRERRRKNRQSGIFHPDDAPPATVFEDFSDEEDDRRRFVDQGRREDAAVRNGGSVRQPERAREPEDRRGGWFSGGGRNASKRAPEMREERPARQASRREQETGSVRR